MAPVPLPIRVEFACVSDCIVDLIDAERGRCELLRSGPPDDGDPETDDSDSNPAASANAFTQKEFRAEGSGSIAKSTDRYHEAHLPEGQNRE